MEPRDRTEARINVHEILETYILDTTPNNALLRALAKGKGIEYDRVKQILNYFNLKI